MLFGTDDGSLSCTTCPGSLYTNSGTSLVPTFTLNKAISPSSRVLDTITAAGTIHKPACVDIDNDTDLDCFFGTASASDGILYSKVCRIFLERLLHTH
jgi:hypothetical protein